MRKELEGNNPYSRLINLYKAVGDCKYHLLKAYQAIEKEIANGSDPAGWRLIRAEMDGCLYGIPELMQKGVDEVLTAMEQANLLRGKV